MSTLKKILSALLFLFLFFISFCLLKNPSLVYRFALASKHQESDLYFQDIANSEKETLWAWTTTTSRRRLTGPGSSPPRCAWKCGRCTPCKPVHVPVPPGNPVTAEYYPEAWRCKCGNRLYMP
ncbi:putative EPIDERMAL PATTERNING FACTOR-like protein [Helianthus annuus]|nr:putative EPIDERMAL PATTERNING FACTOR-like protein [Helianthus annuus]KAJ0956695.1 putative EPIDERMAL PATTERNING FACTOR-like protein [Helianthus annuus]